MNKIYHTPHAHDAGKNFIVHDRGIDSIMIFYDQADLQNVLHHYTFEVGHESTARFFLFLHGQNIQVSCDIIMQGSASFAKIYAIYALSGNQILNFKTQQLHTAPHSSTVVRLQGVLQDDSECEYKGLINISKQAGHTYADQQHKNIMLSDASKVSTDPHIQVYTNEVVCSHGAASSGFDEELLYSLQTRGIPEKEAKKLLLEAFLDTVLIEFPESESIKNRIYAKVCL